MSAVEPIDELADDPESALAAFIEFLVAEEPWRYDAACRGQDATPFFPSRGGSTRPAKVLCARCPVKIECADYAERTGSEYGVWAGKLRNPQNLKNERDALKENRVTGL